VSKPRKVPLIAVPFLVVIQACALVGYLTALGAFAFFCKVLDETSPPEAGK
jgi:hypothetical protein